MTAIWLCAPERKSKAIWWGGFYAGASYNFLIFGIFNENEDDDCPVIRVVKYDKGWNRLGTADLKGANTTKPFNAGSLRCAESGDILYIHTCHEMYKSSDGKNHQANMTLSLRESTMEFLGGNYGVKNNRTGYVSHSFNQFVLVDQDDKLVTMDHGDAYPRSFMLSRFNGSSSQGIFSGFDGWNNIKGTVNTDAFAEFPGEIGQNLTNGRVYGIVETRTGYLAAIDYGAKESEAMKAHLYYYDKATGKGSMRNLGIGDFSTNAQLVPDGLDGGYIVWNKPIHGTPGICWARYDSTGNLGSVHTSTEGYVTDCVPVIWNDKVIWPGVLGKIADKSYDNESVFFSIDRNDNFSVISPGESPTVGGFRDVHENDFFADAVKWAVEEGITTGTEKNYFSPKMNCTRGQAVAFLWRAAGKPEPQSTDTRFTDVRAGSYYETAVQWAVEQGITIGTSADKFSPNAVCTRAQIVTLLHRAAGEPAPAGDSAGFTDVKAGSYYETAVKWAVEQGITVGTAADKFSPNANCTRGQIVTFLYRNAEKK